MTFYCLSKHQLVQAASRGDASGDSDDTTSWDYRLVCSHAHTYFLFHRPSAPVVLTPQLALAAIGSGGDGDDGHDAAAVLAAAATRLCLGS